MSEDVKRVTLKQLYHNKLLFSKVRSLMQQNKNYKYIIMYLNTKGFTMSTASLTNLKKKIQESDETGVPLSDLVDKRTKTSINDLSRKKMQGYIPDAIQNKDTDEEPKTPEDIPTEFYPTTSKVWSARDIFENVMQKSMVAIANADMLDVPSGLKAAELMEKYYGDRNRGLTSEALKQYQIIMKAQMTAIQEILLRYFPEEDKRKEILDEMDKTTNEIVKQVGLTPDGKSLLKSLRQAGLEVD